MAKSARRPPVFPATDQPATASPAMPDTPANTPPPRSQRPPSRQGKRQISLSVDPEVHRQLRTLAAKEDKSLEALGKEALNLLFAQYGLARIAA